MMNIKLKTVLKVLAVVFFAVQVLPAQLSAQDSGEGKYVDISAPEAFSLIKENSSNEDFFIIDVRTPGEYKSGHIENALMIDFYSEDFVRDFEKLDKSKIYLIYCRSGNRSSRTVRFMKRLGFVSVYNMQGGILSWVSSGLPLVR